METKESLQRQIDDLRKVMNITTKTKSASPQQIMDRRKKIQVQIDRLTEKLKAL